MRVSIAAQSITPSKFLPVAPIPYSAYSPQRVVPRICDWAQLRSPHVHDTLSPQRFERLPHWLML